MEVLDSNGELHERYTTNTVDVDYVEERLAQGEVERVLSRVASALSLIGDHNAAVIHETIVPKVHHIVTTDITRHHHKTEIQRNIQPVTEKVYEPERHWVETVNGELVEVSLQEIERIRHHYKYATRVEETVGHEIIEGEPYGHTWKHSRSKKRIVESEA